MLKKILKKIVPKIEEFEYDNLYSSRSVIKNQYINEGATVGFYGEDIWAIVHNEVKSKIEPGISLYGEIVGFLPSGKHIQKGYDYGCLPPEREFVRTGEDSRRHKFLVYRITYTKPDGTVIEFSWQQILTYCQKYNLDTVKQFYFGSVKELFSKLNVEQQKYLNPLFNTDEWREQFLNLLSNSFNLEKKDLNCINSVWAEGICIRKDGLESYSTFKLKSRNFLLQESKQLDTQETDIESEN